MVCATHLSGAHSYSDGSSTTGALADPIPSCTFKDLSSRITLFLLHCQFLPLYRLIFIGYKHAVTFPIFKSKTKKKKQTLFLGPRHSPQTKPHCHALLHDPAPERVVSPTASPSLFSCRQTSPYCQFPLLSVDSVVEVSVLFTDKSALPRQCPAHSRYSINIELINDFSLAPTLIRFLCPQLF